MKNDFEIWAGFGPAVQLVQQGNFLKFVGRESIEPIKRVSSLFLFSVTDFL